MFFFLSKILLFLLSPFFWFILCLALYFFWKKVRWKKHLKWTAIGIFIFFTNSVIISEFTNLWEVPGTKMNQLKQRDVAIVLGGMSQYNSDLETLSIRRPADRIFQAITLYKTKKVKKILISGNNGYITDRGLHEAKQMKEILVVWGIPEKDILTEEKSKNTHENARNTRKLLKQSYPELNSYLLVTSGIHMRRSLACFEKEGLHCTPFSTDLRSNQSGNYYWDQYLIPNVFNFTQWNDLLKEIVGYIAYDVVGHI